MEQINNLLNYTNLTKLEYFILICESIKTENYDNFQQHIINRTKLSFDFNINDSCYLEHVFYYIKNKGNDDNNLISYLVFQECNNITILSLIFLRILYHIIKFNEKKLNLNNEEECFQIYYDMINLLIDNGFDINKFWHEKFGGNKQIPFYMLYLYQIHTNLMKMIDNKNMVYNYLKLIMKNANLRIICDYPGNNLINHIFLQQNEIFPDFIKCLADIYTIGNYYIKIKNDDKILVNNELNGGNLFPKEDKGTFYLFYIITKRAFTGELKNTRNELFEHKLLINYNKVIHDKILPYINLILCAHKYDHNSLFNKLPLDLIKIIFKMLYFIR
jgi:hypothetical protein